MKKNGHTLIELIIAMSTACIVMLTVAMLIQSGYKSWKSTYNSAYCQSQLDSISSISAFCSIGRKSNKKDYYVYTVTGTTFTKVMPVTNPEEVLAGQAVEFRYWSTDLTSAMLTPTNIADRYALFYLNNGQLKLDIGTSTGGPTGGAIDATGRRVTGAGLISTTVLASFVNSVTFTHTTKDMAGDGYGSVRMNLIINNPADNQSKTFLAATCLRNTWPE